MTDESPPEQMAAAIAHQIIARMEANGSVAFSSEGAAATAKSLLAEIVQRMDLAKLRQELAVLIPEDVGPDVA